MANTQLEVGDVVIRPDGTEMTVSSIGWSTDGVSYVGCQWFDANNQLQEQLFPLSSIELVPELVPEATPADE